MYIPWKYTDFQDKATNVAQKLLGMYLIHRTSEVEYIGKIVETEAYGGSYRGKIDDASHACRKRTNRNEPMFQNGGISYVYLIYGMYHCFNVVTSLKDDAQAVLIRAIEPIQGKEYMLANRKLSIPDKRISNGPGKLCTAMNITIKENSIPLWKAPLFIATPTNKEMIRIVKGKRVNISYAEKGKYFPWRFFIQGNLYVSKG